MSIESGRNLKILFSVKYGHVDRLFFWMAFRSVFFFGLPMLRCRKLRVSLMVPYGRIALIRGSTCCPNGGVFSACGNIQSLVAGSLQPVKIVFPYLFTCTLCFVDVDVHTLSHITGIDMRGSWMLSHLNAVLACSGSPSIFIWN